MLKTLQSRIILLVTLIIVLFFTAFIGYLYTQQRADLSTASIIALLFLFIALITVYRMTIRIMKPMTELTVAVEKSVDSGFSPIKISTDIQEIQGLVDAFNGMTTEIHTYTDDLETLVNERTYEIDAVNKQLNTQIGQLASAVQRLNVLASVDTLTGLKNRMALYRRLEFLTKNITSGDLDCFSLLFMDLDNFKYFNDTFGHDVGDMFLSDISKSFKEILGIDDFIARYGGDEFVVLLDNNNYTIAKNVSYKLERAIDGYNNDIKVNMKISDDVWNKEITKRLGLSIGVMEVNGSSDLNIDDLIKHADEMMYKNKQKRKADALANLELKSQS